MGFYFSRQRLGGKIIGSELIPSFVEDSLENIELGVDNQLVLFIGESNKPIIELINRDRASDMLV